MPIPQHTTGSPQPTRIEVWLQFALHAQARDEHPPLEWDSHILRLSDDEFGRILSGEDSDA